MFMHLVFNVVFCYMHPTQLIYIASNWERYLLVQ